MTTTLPIAWMIARAAGLVAFGLLTLSVWLGLAMSTRLLGPRRQKSLLGLHRTLVWTGLSAVGLHAFALMLDPVLHLRPAVRARAVRFTVEGRRRGGRRRRRLAEPRPRRVLPNAKWIGHKGWRRLHYASFAAFALSLGHALMVGTDLRGLGGPILAAPRGRPRALALVLPAARAEANAATDPRGGVTAPSSNSATARPRR